jgi:hypothetical protein
VDREYPLGNKKIKIIDLSVPIEHDPPSEPWLPKIRYSPDHGEGATEMRKRLDVDLKDLFYTLEAWVGLMRK